MINLTLREVINYQAPNLQSHDYYFREYCVYAIKDGNLALYVGKSWGRILSRIKEHITGNDWQPFPDNLGKVVIDNRPDSDNWQVELYTLADFFDDYKYYDLDTAEQGLIEHYRPCMNHMNNYNGQHLPERYYKNGSFTSEDANEGVKL